MLTKDAIPRRLCLPDPGFGADAGLNPTESLIRYTRRLHCRLPLQELVALRHVV